MPGAVKYFEDKLGFRVIMSPGAEPPSATVEVGDQYLYVFQTGNDSDGERRSPDLSYNPRGLDHVSFTVSDVDAAYGELRCRGVEFESEPATVDEWGIRIAVFRDPEGNDRSWSSKPEGTNV